MVAETFLKASLALPLLGIVAPFSCRGQQLNCQEKRMSCPKQQDTSHKLKSCSHSGIGHHNGIERWFLAKHQLTSCFSWSARSLCFSSCQMGSDDSCSIVVLQPLVSAALSWLRGLGADWELKAARKAWEKEVPEGDLCGPIPFEPQKCVLSFLV